MDRESLGEPSNADETETSQILEALIRRHDCVDLLAVDMSKASDPSDDDRTPDVVHLRCSTEQKGWASLPGPRYGYHIVYSKGRTKETHGNISPQPQLFQNLFGFAGEGGPHLQEVSAEEIQRHVLLTATGCKVADVVISESPLARRSDIPANYDANVFSRSQAIPVVAHYLRSQQIYVYDPRCGSYAGTRKVFYHSGVYALARNIRAWEAKARTVLQPRYSTDCHEMIGRLIRVLKAFDDLRFHLGALQTSDSYDDVADCVDRILWSLCGAVDVIARSLHYALQLRGQARYAKFQSDWYRDKFRPNYSDAAGIPDVDRTQAALATVFELRNTVHYRALRASGVVNQPAPYVGRDRGRVRLIIPNDVYNRIDADERARWGFEEIDTDVGMRATADLATVSSSAVDAVFSFLDELCRMVALEKIEGKDAVLERDVYAVPDGSDTTATIRRLLGFNTTESEATGAP